MKFPLIVAVLACLTLSCASGPDSSEREFDRNQLSVVAEDLWGSPIDLASFRNGITVIAPFSPST
jgi:hypothetical protein